MSEVLYRKYRPQTFDDVVGQGAIVTALSKAVNTGKPGHAYLFSGGRGTGKTSLARIMAHALGVAHHDILEMDAASNRGVDDVRVLNDNVYTNPMSSPYKVYIIDEVHMLTKEAFNALLKTLEEPPKHVIFILATTELDRVPETIKSRCQLFQFKEPSRDILKTHVETIAKKEKLSLEKGVSELIAKAGRGSFRDTLGVLQSAIDLSGEKSISVDVVHQVSGGAHDDDVFRFISSVLEGTDDVWKLVEAKERKHLEAFIEEAIETVRKILLVRYAPTYAEELLQGISDDTMKHLEIFSKEKRIHSEFLIHLLELFMRMKETPLPKAALTIFLAKIQEEKNA